MDRRRRALQPRERYSPATTNDSRVKPACVPPPLPAICQPRIPAILLFRRPAAGQMIAAARLAWYRSASSVSNRLSSEVRHLRRIRLHDRACNTHCQPNSRFSQTSPWCWYAYTPLLRHSRRYTIVTLSPSFREKPGPPFVIYYDWS